MTQDYIMSVAHTIRKQLFGLTEFNVICSWGIEYPLLATQYKDMPALKIKVDARLFKGSVIIALNEGDDLYEIYLKKQGEEPTLLSDEVFFEDMGNIIDTAIERGTNQAEYDAFCQAEKERLMRELFN